MKSARRAASATVTSATAASATVTSGAAAAAPEEPLGLPLSPIERLPSEMVVQVFSYLGLDDVARGVFVCRAWARLLRGRRALWRRRRYHTRAPLDWRELQAVSCAAPRLRCLHIVAAAGTGLHVAWPDAVLFLHFDARGKLVQELPYATQLEAECMVVSSLAFPACLNWVRCDSVRKLYIAAQCSVVQYGFAVPFRFTNPDDLYNVRTCGGSGSGVFCAFCTYTHHRSCAGIHCPERSADDRQVSPWCHPDTADDGFGAAYGWRLRSDGLLPDPPEAGAGSPLAMPALEEANVLSAQVSPRQMASLCALSRPRVLNVGYRPEAALPRAVPQRFRLPPPVDEEALNSSIELAEYLANAEEEAEACRRRHGRHRRRACRAHIDPTLEIVKYMLIASACRRR